MATDDVAPDPDRHAVREWLRSNDHDPHPREIRWWPARTLDELYRRQLTAAKDAVEDSEDDDPQLRDYVEQLEHDGPERVCRLKFRSKNEVGAQIPHDRLVRPARRPRATRAQRHLRSDSNAEIFPRQRRRAVIQGRDSLSLRAPARRGWSNQSVPVALRTRNLAAALNCNTRTVVRPIADAPTTRKPSHRKWSSHRSRRG